MTNYVNFKINLLNKMCALSSTRKISQKHRSIKSTWSLTRSYLHIVSLHLSAAVSLHLSAANKMSCGHLCQCQLSWPQDTLGLKRDPINSEKAWLDFAVRLLSREVVGKGKGQETVWNDKCKPDWWDVTVGVAWKNPTTNPKDTKEVLKKKYLALEKHLVALARFPKELEVEAKLWNAGKKQELYLHTKWTSLVCKVTSLHSFVISISENVKELNSNVNILLVDCITKCLKSTLTAIENLKATESVGVKRQYSDVAYDNPVPSKASKSELSYHVSNQEALRNQNSRDIGVHNIPHLFPNTTISTEVNDNLSVSKNKIRECLDIRMSSREVQDIQKDCQFIPSVNTLNLDPEIANNTVITDGVNMTTTVTEDECVLNISSTEFVPSLTRSPNFNSDLSLSSDPKEFGSCSRKSRSISKANKAPSRVDSTSPMIPPRREFIPIRQLSSACLDSSDSKNSSPSLDGYLCPEFINYTSNYLSSDCNLKPSSLLRSSSPKLTNFTEIDTSPDSKPSSLFDDSTVNNRSPNINSPLSATRLDSFVHEHSMSSTDPINSKETDITTSLVDIDVNFPWSPFDKTADLTNQMSQYMASIDVSILCKQDESKLLQQYLLDDNDDLSVFYNSLKS